MPFCDRDEERGYQLYQSNPSGNYGGWKAVAIGANHQGANNLLKQDYKEGLSLEEAKKLLMKASPLPSILLLYPHLAFKAGFKLCRECGIAVQIVECRIQRRDFSARRGAFTLEHSFHFRVTMFQCLSQSIGYRSECSSQMISDLPHFLLGLPNCLCCNVLF